MALELTGRIKLIGDEQSFPSGFVKKQFVITTEEQYPQDIAIDLIKDRISLISGYNVGDAVKVQFNIRGSEYQGKYYVNLQAWRLEKVAAAASATVDTTPQVGAPVAPPAPVTMSAPVDDDLPF